MRSKIAYAIEVKAEGDHVELLFQALGVRVDVSPKEVDVRVDVPMIAPVEAPDLVTTEQTSASLFACH